MPGGVIVKCLITRCFKSKNVYAEVGTWKGGVEGEYGDMLNVEDLGYFFFKQKTAYEN